LLERLIRELVPPVLGALVPHAVGVGVDGIDGRLDPLLEGVRFDPDGRVRIVEIAVRRVQIAALDSSRRAFPCFWVQ